MPVRSSLPILVLIALLGTMAMMSFVAVLGPLVRELGLAEWHAGTAAAASGVLWMLAARRWGMLSDRIGRRRVLLTGLVAYVTVFLALAVYVDLALRGPPAALISALVLIGARALVGLFYAAIPPSAAALVADETAPEARAGAMAKLGGANAVGMVLGPAGAGLIAFHDLALALYAAVGVSVMALLVVWWRLPRKALPGRAPDERSNPSPVSTKTDMAAWRDPRLRLPMLAASVAMVSVSIAQVVVGFFAMDRLHLPAGDAARVTGLALTAVGGGLMVAQTLVIRFKSVAPTRWIALGALVSAAGFAATALIQVEWQLQAAYALAAFGMGFVFPSVQALAANSVAAHEQGAAAGMVASMQGLGMVLGPLVGTMLYRFSPGAPYVLIGVVLLGLSLAAARHQAQDAPATTAANQ